jgi:hypothetical protein
MTTNAAPPGWHPDPSNPGGSLRWWDGIAWTNHTHEAAPTASYGAPESYGAPPAYRASTSTSYATRNKRSLTAIGVTALYIVLAMAAHIVFIGILPVAMAIRAIRQKEQLAPFAVVAAVIAVILAFTALR